MPGTWSYDAGTNTVTVVGGTSGSPADFASFVAADRGNAAPLLPAHATGADIPLLYQVRPVELLAILLTFELAGTNAGAGDRIDLTGTDCRGAPQTESLDVSGGDGTYITAKYWRTVTAFTTYGFDTGTVTVTQPIWGVIWDKGNGQYQLDCVFNAGDGSTATYFGDGSKEIVLNVSESNQIKVNNYAIFRLGELLDAASRTGRHGCTLLNIAWNVNRIINAANLSEIYFYETLFASIAGSPIIEIKNSTKGQIYDCITDSIYFRYGGPDLDINNLYSHSGTYAYQYPGGANITNLKFYNVTNGIAVYSSNSIFLKEAIGQISGSYEFYWINYTGNGFFIDCDFGRNDWRNYYNGGAANTGNIYRQYTLNLHLTDKNGNNISGAVVVLKDNNSDEVVNTSTATDGTITFSGEDGSPENNAVTHTRYHYDGGGISHYRVPWTLTITAPGYQDYQDVITIDRKMDLVVALVASNGGGGLTQIIQEMEVMVATAEPLTVALAAAEISVALSDDG
jgi:hypothetical protein